MLQGSTVCSEYARIVKSCTDLYDMSHQPVYLLCVIRVQAFVGVHQLAR